MTQPDAAAGYPNFYLVGAPKSGTTSLYTYLLEHPNIFLPVPDGGSVKQKEPMFFATDLREEQDYTDEQDYLRLYSASDDGHLAVGDASVLYLYSEVALRNIHRKMPSAKIVAVLRNPVEAVHSYHAELCRSLAEDVESFEEAWDLQAARRQGKAIPGTCRTPARLQYRDVYDYPTQLERLWRIFPKEQTLIILFDDFRENPAECCGRIQDFLGVSRLEMSEFRRVNENRQLRSRFLARLLLRPPPALRKMAEALKSTLGINYTAIAVWLTNLNLAAGEREALSPGFCQQLRKTFEPDIRKLSQLLDVDLSAWTSGRESAPSMPDRQPAAQILLHG